MENYPLDSALQNPEAPGLPAARIRQNAPEWSAKKFFQKRVDFTLIFRYNTALYEILREEV